MMPTALPVPENFSLYCTLAILGFFALSVYVLKIENAYRKDFDLTPITPLKFAGGSVVACLAFVGFALASRQRLPAECLVPVAVAAATLNGIRRIDAFSLLIPNRLQALGALSGMVFLILHVASGELWQEQGKEMLFGLSIVGLLWLMSFIYQRFRGRIGIGFGDIKLLSWLTFFAGKSTVDVISISVVVGILQLFIIAGRESWRQRKLTLPGSQDAFAFAPSIVTGAAIAIFLRYGG